MSVEVVEHDGVTYAEIIRADLQVEKTRFFSPPESSFQFGLLAHEAGLPGAAALPQVVRAPRSTICSRCSSSSAASSTSSSTRTTAAASARCDSSAGDAIVLIHGVHAINVIEDFQALSVKQGPFFGDEVDKVEVVVETVA